MARLLRELGYSLQAPRKTREGKQHPDRDAQFQYIATQVKAFQNAGEPVISVDCKKKELVGDFHNKGREYHPKGEPPNVRVHDFIDKELGKAIPYGVYDLTENNGWVSVGVDRETAQFAVETIRRWWRNMGQERYQEARKLLITADGGGGNGSRIRLWKLELQHLADEIGLEVTVAHFPPATSKWNKIEHRMWSQVTNNWRGKPLITREVIVSLIANTKTRTGLEIEAELDECAYPKGLKVTDNELNEINLERAEFHGNWNYTIGPRKD